MSAILSRPRRPPRRARRAGLGAAAVAAAGAIVGGTTDGGCPLPGLPPITALALSTVPRRAHGRGARLSDRALAATRDTIPPRDLTDNGAADPADPDTDAADAWRRPDLFGSSLIDDTLAQLEGDALFQETRERYDRLGAARVHQQERAQRRRALDALGVPDFAAFLRERGLALRRREPTILQLNIGLHCNQACSHCHVESSPLRTEAMTPETAARCLALLRATPSVRTLDITGGAPELNPCFRYLVGAARDFGGPDLEIIDRCNLTVLQEPGQEDLLDFLVRHRVRVVASLPCYSAANVDAQRGRGVFERSVAALLALNEAGYGRPGTGLVLDLVYNPASAVLPPDQARLEGDYKRELAENFGVLFDSLFTITNMPIKRFADFLHRTGELRDYMDLLVRTFNPDATRRLMCLDLVSVGYDGTVYDCDFNQQLGYAAGGGLSVFDLEDLRLPELPIRLDNHCFGCTAGMGSSCQGTTV